MKARKRFLTFVNQLYERGLFIEQDNTYQNDHGWLRGFSYAGYSGMQSANDLSNHDDNFWFHDTGCHEHCSDNLCFIDLHPNDIGFDRISNDGVAHNCGIDHYRADDSSVDIGCANDRHSDVTHTYDHDAHNWSAFLGVF